MLPHASPTVMSWLDRQPSAELFLTTITLAELLFGVAILPEGKRRDKLSYTIDRLENRIFVDRILPFDTEAAHTYAELCARARANGQRLEGADPQIAAIALARGCPVATRDVTPFRAAGVEVINPWEIA